MKSPTNNHVSLDNTYSSPSQTIVISPARTAIITIINFTIIINPKLASIIISTNESDVTSSLPSSPKHKFCHNYDPKTSGPPRTLPPLPHPNPYPYFSARAPGGQPSIGHLLEGTRDASRFSSTCLELPSVSAVNGCFFFFYCWSVHYLIVEYHCYHRHLQNSLLL